MYKNGSACGILPYETAKRMGFHGDFDPLTARPLAPTDKQERKADYDPTPWCSYGHMRKADCDCGPIAENE